MGGSGGSTPQQSTQVSQVELPPWVSDAAMQNYAFAQNVANRPLQQYQGQMVADVAPAQQQAWNLAQSSGNAGMPQYGAAQSGFLGVMNAGSPLVTSGSLANTDLNPYMNPYTQSVINTTLPIYQQNLAQSQNQQASNAVAANAFGGSRQGVQQGVTQAQGAQGMAQMAQQLNQSNFSQAQAAAQGDIANQLKAAQGNQQAILSGQQNQLTAATVMANLGTQAQKNVLQQFMELEQAGTDQQTQAQNVINANMNKFNQAWNYPTTQLNTLLSGLSQTPYGQTQITSGQTQPSQSEPNYMQAGLGVLSMLGGLFGSDKRMKKDIAKLGKDAPTDLPIYSFRYKGAPDNSPKIAGPMAQDVEKKFPEHVVKVGPKKMRFISKHPVAHKGALTSGSKATPFGMAQQEDDGNHYVQHQGKKFMIRRRGGASL